MKNFFTNFGFQLILIICMLCQSDFKVNAEEINSSRYLTLSNEALAAARYNKVIELSCEFLDNNINNNNCTSEIFVSHLTNLRNAYSSLGKENEYEEFCRNLYNTIDPNKGSTLIRSFILISLDCKGDFESTAFKRFNFTHFGDNSSGIDFFDENLGTLPESIIDSKPILKAWLPILRADLLSFGEDFEEAYNELDKASNILKESFGTDSPEYLLEGLSREILEAQQGEWNKAIELALKNKTLLESFNQPSKELYALNSRLLQYYLNIKDFKSASEIAKIALVRPSVFEATNSIINYRSFEGPMLLNSPSNIFAGMDYNLACLNSSLALFEMEEISDGTKNANKVLYGLEKDIANNYSSFAFNRASSANKAKVDLLVQTSPDLALKNPNDSLLQSSNYDAALIYKQLSLSAGNLYRNISARLGNNAISNRYKELEQTRRLLDIANVNQTDSLIQRIAQLESYLQRNLNSRSNTSLSSLPKWTDVRQALNPDEAAIEFSIAKTLRGEKYIASIIKSNSNFPEIVELCNINEIDEYEDHCKSTHTFESLWKPISEKLLNVETIYFSPVGNLNLLPIEYVPVDDNRNLNEVFTVLRLSTTNELALRNEENHPNDILLYGGVKYNLDDTEKQSNEKIAESTTERYFSDSVGIEETSLPGLRAGVAYLPGTLDEVYNISKIFTDYGGNAQIIEGALATETSIKGLDGVSIPTIHLATHGFTVPKKSRSRLGRLLSKNDDRSTFEEQSLGRSGLMMAGAANTLDEKDNNNLGFDDGILTGREISRIDLSGINMMVLSACESGLGEIGAEGVIGLQRGLKRAGVHTLVMTLWKVDDEGTALLMQEFYRNLLNGKNAAESMRESQKYLRAYEDGRFDDPQFWAAFIILDSI